MQSRQSLALRQHQNLALTPQLQQSIRFLQLSAQDLEQEVAQALADNPLLEREGEYDTDSPEAQPQNQDDDYVQELGLTAGPGSTGRDHDDDDAGRAEIGQAVTLREHLLQQLHLTRASERDQVLVALLIEELDENGLLPLPLSDVRRFVNDALVADEAQVSSALRPLPSPEDSTAEDVPLNRFDAVLPVPEDAVDDDELLAALRLLQSFDPPGVGARSTSECLILQLQQRQRQASGGLESDVLDCAKAIVGHHLDWLAQGNMARLREVLGCSAQVLTQAHQLILTLDPKPGRAWSHSVADYVVPELVVTRGRQGWDVRLNGAVVPKVRVNPIYEQWVRDEAQGPEKSPILAQLQQAHGLVKSVAQRFETVLRVGQCIVTHQQAFFDQGVQAMRPLVLRDIAQDLQLHESTVSRATRQKYMQTPWGVFELKYFLGTALGGEGLAPAASGTAVRAMIREMIQAESPQKPLSDSKIAEALAKKGVDIARRTVAKYREAEGIETASVRKARAGLV